MEAASEKQVLLDKYFKENKVEITLYPDKTVKVFKTYKSFKSFIDGEIEYWGKYTDGQFTKILLHFRDNVKRFLDGIDNTVVTASDQANLIQAIRNANINKTPCIYSNTKAAVLLREQYNNNKKQTEFNMQYDTIKGILDFYSSYEAGAKIENGIATAEKTLEGIKQKYHNSLTELDSAYNDKVADIDKAFTDEKNKIETWSQKTQSDLEEYLKLKQAKLVELENLYNEKLRLEGPAKYWEVYSEECRQKGAKWRNWTIFTTGIIVIYLTLVLFALPYSLLWHKDITPQSVTSIVIFALITSLLVYLNRLFVKLSLSSYHLSRDAKERHELIFLFLSLLNEKAITPDDRNVILQSLFSRAETGLLKGDSSPEMPEGVIKHITGNFSR